MRIANLCLLPPIIVGIFSGKKKPESSLEYLSEFINELEDLLCNGISIRDSDCEVVVNALICDSPARAFVCGVKGHNSYYGCSKCEQKGTYYRRRIVYCSKVKVLRTDRSFAVKKNRNHHNEESPFEKINVGMVSQVPLDPMHLVYLGVVRKILFLPCKGDIRKCRLSAQQRISVTNILKSLRTEIPTEFARKPRGFDEVERWKATECRLFLLYLSPMVLKGVLDGSYYRHLLCLHVAVRILSSSQSSCEELDYAEQLLQYFVEQFSKLYGKENLSFNVHGLLHLVSDSRRYGSIEAFSAFPYENNLHTVKKLIRSHNRPLQQLVKRISETCLAPASIATSQEFLFDSKKQMLRAKGFVLTSNPPDCVCRVDTGEVIQICKILKENEMTIIRGRAYQSLRNFYESPCASSELGIYLCKRKNLGSLKDYPVNSVIGKCMGLTYNRHDVILIPLLHV